MAASKFFATVSGSPSWAEAEPAIAKTRAAQGERGDGSNLHGLPLSEHRLVYRLVFVFRGPSAYTPMGFTPYFL
jgi:hypothetical protein